MNVTKILEKFPEEGKLVISSHKHWRLSNKTGKYENVKNNRVLNEEDLGWMTFKWMIENSKKINNIDLKIVDGNNDTIICSMLEIISKSIGKVDNGKSDGIITSSNSSQVSLANKKPKNKQRKYKKKNPEQK